MVRSTALLSVIALYVAALTVEAQKPKSTSNESIANLLNYLKEHPLSENNGVVKSAAIENSKHRHRNENAVPAKKEDKQQVSESEMSDPEMSNSVTEAGAPPPANEEEEQETADTADTNNDAAPADGVASTGAAPSQPAAAAAADIPASNMNEASKEEEPVKEGENDAANAVPMKADEVNKADASKDSNAKNEVSRESINDPTKDTLRETLRESLRQSVRDSMKNNKFGEASKTDILASLRNANQILAQSNHDDNVQMSIANNPPKDAGVALAGEASSNSLPDLNSNTTESSSSDNLLPSDGTVPEIAEPTSIPITNFDMLATAGMIYTNGGSSSIGAASASMSAPFASGTASFSSSSSSASTSSNNQSSRSSSTSAGRSSATSTNAAHSSGNINNYSLMFIGFTIFMSNMITIGFLW